MKIVISGPAVACDAESGEMITDPQVLRTLDGLRHDADLCANYLYDDLLNDISISGGAIQVAFGAGRAGLRVVSQYWAPGPLSDDQLQVLIDQTRGQWSDGIGEACFDEWSQESGIHLDLAPFAHTDEEPVAEQVEDGRAAPLYAHLAKAVWNGKVDVVREAVAAKADLNVIYDGHTPLLLALAKQDVASALLLIEGGADVNRAAVGLDKTPLHACAGMKRPEDAVAVAKALIARGADLQAIDAFGQTALAEAREQNKTELVAVLEAAGAT